MKAESLLSLLQFRAYRDPVGIASELLETGTANLQQRAQG